MKNVTYINAGAGSGKTYTLTEKLAEELASREVLPSQVILTTFTELAAAEFREKSRNKILAKAAEIGSDATPEELLQKEYLLNAAAQIDSAAIGTVHSIALHFIKKFWYLLDYGADIQTISERDETFYLNQSLTRIINERDSNGNLAKQKDLHNFHLFHDYFNFSDDYLFWQQYLKDVVEKMEYYNVDDIQTSIDKSMESLRSVFNKPTPDIEQVKDALLLYRDFCLNQKKKTGDKADRTAHEADRLYNMADQRLTTVERHHWFLDSKELTKDKNVVAPTALGKSDAGESSAWLKAAMEEYDAAEIHLKILEPFVESVFNLAAEWRNDYICYKKNKRLISYNDMEKLFLHLITEEPEVKDYIRDQFRLIMVDEFQDSNPIQLKIFNQLSDLIAGNDGHSFWVGDPKQAIYGFRGADTDLVNSVSKHFNFYDDEDFHDEEGPNRLGTGRLVYSWRSRPKLVELVNETFYKPFSDYGMNELLIKLTPKFTDDTLPTESIEHWECEETNKKKAAAALAVGVERLLQSKIKVHKGQMDAEPSELSYRDVAILCRKNDEVKAVVRALRQRNIPVSEPEDNILQRIEIQLVIVLLQFIQNPTNKHVRADLMRLLWGKSTAEILKDRISYVLGLKEGEQDNWHYCIKPEGTATPENDCPDEEEPADNETDENADEYISIDEIVEKDDIPTTETDDEISLLVAKLHKQLKRYKHLSIPEMVRALIYECDIPALTAKWGESHVRQQNLSTLQHLADDYDQMCLQMGLGSSISGFINYLNSNEPEKESDNISDTVKVFTYHGAKGLEWPVVILHNLSNDALESNDFIKKNIMKVQEMVLSDNSSETDPFDKKYFIHVFPYILKGHTWTIKVPAVLQSNIADLPFFTPLKEKIASEECRLLYVGMTRAKDKLVSFGTKQEYNWLLNLGVKNPSPDYIWGDFDTEEKKEQFKPEAVRYFSAEETSGETETETETETAAETYSITKKTKKRTEFENRYLSPSKIEQFAGYCRHEPWAEKGKEIDTTGWGKDYESIGSCIHDIFAVYQHAKDQQNKEAAIRIIGGYGLASKLDGNVDTILRAADWLYELLQKKFPQKENDTIEHEYPFQMTLESGQTLRGEMDLLWFYTSDDGKQHCVLIDYKSFHGNIYDKHTPVHYAQLSAYTAALASEDIDVTHALIYYPVGGLVHELKR